MKEIANEVNKLASEINNSQDSLNKSMSQLSNKEDKAKSLEAGFNFLGFSNLVYAFTRFYPLSDSIHLSQESKELFKQLQEGIEANKHLLNG